MQAHCGNQTTTMLSRQPCSHTCLTAGKGTAAEGLILARSNTQRTKATSMDAFLVPLTLDSDADATGLVHACTIAKVHACTITLAHACTLAKVHVRREQGVGVVGGWFCSLASLQITRPKLTRDLLIDSSMQFFSSSRLAHHCG